MKKKFKNNLFVNHSKFNKVCLIMRLTLILLVVSLMQSYATGYTQSAKISLTLKNVSLKQALKEIEKQSDYTFVYSDSKIDVNKKVDINVKDCALAEVLDQLIAESGIRYTSVDNHIVLTDKQQYVYRLPAITHESVLTRESVDMETLSPIRNMLLQQTSVTGQVTSAADGQPLPGVNIIVKGTTTGTTTDINGSFSLNVPSPNVTLVFSFVGFQTQEIALAGQKSVTVAMAEETQQLQEIVVVGYGTRMKEELTGAVSTVSNKEMKVSTAPSVVSRMQGRVSGVSISTANVPGGEATIRIRGIGTINDPDPLYVVDGVPVGPGNNINPNDVESISVLKDASSAAIYGSRGANGVVIVTTKKGKQNQKPTVTFSVRTGFKQATNKYDLLNTAEYGQALWLEAKNNDVSNFSHPQYGSGATPVIPDYILPAGAKEGDAATNPALYKYPDYVIFKANKTGTDWYKEIYQKGLVQEYDMSVSGGGNNTTYSISANYLDEEGILKWTDFKRFNLRLGIESNFNKWLKVGQNIQAIYIDQKGDFGDNGEGTAISMAYRMQPIVPVYDIAGNFAGSKAPGMGNAGNPVAQLYRAKDNDGKWMRAMGSTYAEATIMKGLSVKTLLGYNFGIWNAKSYTIPTYEASEPNKIPGFSQNTNYSILWNWTNTINYNITLADIHKISIVAGTEAIQNNYQEMGASRSQYFNLSPDYMYLNSGESNKDNYGSGSAWSMFSEFGRINYDLKGRYFLEGTIRRDGSSRFGTNKRYGVFPAASFAWELSQESFMASTKSWLDMLKLRVGYGTAGNDRIGDYNGFSTYATNNYTAAYNFNGSHTSSTAGFIPNSTGSEDVSWETTKTVNFGIDGRLLNNKITFALDIWSRRTSDMLYQLKVPEVNGLATPPYVNIGEMKNTGYDIELGYNNTLLDGKFTYAVNLTASHYKNKVVSLSDKVKETIYYGERQIDYSAATVGYAFPEFYGYRVEGIYQTDAEAAAGPQYGSYNQAGHFKYADLNGDGQITMDGDRTFIGSPHPKMTGGLNIDLGYANFDLNLFFYGVYGNKMINYVSRWIDYGQFNGGLSKDALYNSWTPTNKGARLPMLDQNSRSQDASTAYVQDGSFLRLKNVRLGYTVPQQWAQKAKVSSLRVYLQVTNVFTATKYDGLDPELNSSGMSLGVDKGAWPTPREVMLGLSIGL